MYDIEERIKEVTNAKMTDAAVITYNRVNNNWGASLRSGSTTIEAAQYGDTIEEAVEKLIAEIVVKAQNQRQLSLGVVKKQEELLKLQRLPSNTEEIVVP